MKIVSCFKLVPEEQDITVKADKTLDTSKAEPKINQFDLNAIEASVELKTVLGEVVISALSVGGKMLEHSKSRKDILSRGPDDLTLVIDEQFEHLLPHQTAFVLAAAAKKIGFDIIICGDGSGDLYAQQVGLLMGEVLQIPAINAVSKIVSASGGKLTVERTLEDEVEVLEVPLPAVIAVTTDINTPKIPAMKAILAAGKKSITVFNSADLSLGQIPALAQMLTIQAPEQKERQKVVLAGDGDDQIAAFVEQLRKELN